MRAGNDQTAFFKKLPEAGQVLPLARYDPVLRGTVIYPPAFDGVE